MNLLAAGVFAAAIGWAPIGPAGGSVTAISAGEPMLAGTAHGRLFRSSAGSAWVAIADLEAPIRAIEVTGSDTFVLAGVDLYRMPQRIATGVNAIAVTPDAIFTSTNGAVLVSRDRGATWSSQPLGAASLAVDGNRVFAVRPNGDLEISSDAGASWTKANVPEPVVRVFTHPFRPGTAFAIGASERGYRTSDGVQWSEVHYLTGTFAFDPHDSSAFYSIDTLGRLFRFFDDGAKFTIMHGGPILSLDVAADGTLHAGFREGGAASSSDGGATWTFRNEGLLATEIHSLASSPSVVYAGGVGTMFRSNNGGASWDPVFLLRLLPGPWSAVAIDPNDSQRVWIGAGVSLFFTSDGGVRFNRLLWVPDREPQAIIAAAVDRNDSRAVWVLMNRTFLHFHSDPATLSDRSPSDVESLHAFEIDGGGTILLGASRQRRALLLRSSNGGLTWTSTDVGAGAVTAIHRDVIGTSSGDLIVGGRVVFNTGAPVTSISSDNGSYFVAAGRMFTSRDGVNWRDTGGPLRATVVAGPHVATDGAGVFVRQDLPTRRRIAKR